MKILPCFKGLLRGKGFFYFLVGLNIEFDQVRVQVLGKEELPSMKETISIIWTEESRRIVVMLEPQLVEGSAMISINSSGKEVISSNGGQIVSNNSRCGDLLKSSKPTVWCNHCKKPWHTKETCYKLHGRLPNPNQSQGQNRNGQHGHAHLSNGQTSSDEKTGFVSGEKAQFSKEENDRLKSLLETLEEPSSLCFSAESGMVSVSHALSDSDISFSSSWIQELLTIWPVPLINSLPITQS